MARLAAKRYDLDSNGLSLYVFKGGRVRLGTPDRFLTDSMDLNDFVDELLSIAVNNVAPRRYVWGTI